MSTASMQYAFRAQKSLGLVSGGVPDQLAPVNLEEVEGTVTGKDAPRTYAYSPDGLRWAVALPTGVRVHDTESGSLVHALGETSAVVELKFSAKGTFLMTWERLVKPAADAPPNAQHKNLRIFSTASGKELVAFTQKAQDNWALQFTQDETKALRLISGEVTVFKTADWVVEGEEGGEGKITVVDKKKIEGATGMTVSPGMNPSVAVFVPEKKGAPAAVKVFPLLTLSTATQPASQKTFYKADRAQIKWNALGTALLILTHTDVDNSNKSYYGETSLYLLHNRYGDGGSGERVQLDKEGPIHDFSWSGNSKEFGVVYGYMPAKTMLFDLRVRTLHDFGSGPVNYLSFNPSSRLLLLAGFGNLAGQVTIYDRRTLTKLCQLDAPNTSHCEWSPDGRYLMTATLSPRLRVDNGIRVWYCKGGELVHVQDVDELYQVAWRPFAGEIPFPNTIPPAPSPSPSAQAYIIALQSKAKSPPPTNGSSASASGTSTPVRTAYRPPGARGLAASNVYKREDELPTPTPSRGHTPNPERGGGRGGRYVPGAQHHHQHSPSRGPPQQGGENKEKRKRNKGAKNPGANGKDADGGDGVVRPTPVPANQGNVPVVNEPAPAGESEEVAATQKKIRNLNKKLKAIEELKEKQKKGEKLENTQLKKMEGEAEIRKELKGLEG